MANITQTIPLGAPRRAVVHQPLWRRVLKRPEAGALGGAILVLDLVLNHGAAVPAGLGIHDRALPVGDDGNPAVPVALFMIGGEFDLSAGVAVTASSLVASMFATQVAGNVWAGVAFALIFSLGIGALNGYLLLRTRLPSFLVTLSTFLMLQGLNIAITKLITGNVATEDISRHARLQLGADRLRLQHPLSEAPAYRSRSSTGSCSLGSRPRSSCELEAGNWIFAVGGQRDSARAVGVPIRQGHRRPCSWPVGFGCWFLGMHMLFAYDTVQSGAGVGNGLLYIAASVVGGCLLTGGYGSAIGSALGAFIFGMTTEGVIYADWDADWFMFFVGAMLLIATVVNFWIRSRISRGNSWPTNNPPKSCSSRTWARATATSPR